MEGARIRDVIDLAVSAVTQVTVEGSRLLHVLLHVNVIHIREGPFNSSPAEFVTLWLDQHVLFKGRRASLARDVMQRSMSSRKVDHSVDQRVNAAQTLEATSRARTGTCPFHEGL